MDRTFVLIGALAGFIGVALGAFGAHGLKTRVSPDMLAVFETGVRYQMYHAIALLLLGTLAPTLSPRLANIAGWGFTVGILVFSGSLYALVLSDIRILGAITPIGGVAFLIGWACLAYATI